MGQGQNMICSERRSQAKKKDRVQKTGSFGGSAGDLGMIGSLMTAVSFVCCDKRGKMQLHQRATVGCSNPILNVDVSLKICLRFLRNVRFRITKGGGQCAARQAASKPVSVSAAFLSGRTGAQLLPRRRGFERFCPISSLRVSPVRARGAGNLYAGQRASVPWSGDLRQTEFQRSYPAFLPVRWATAVTSRSPRVGKHAYSFPHAWENCFANRG